MKRRMFRSVCTLLLIVAFLRPAESQTADLWQWRNPLPQANNLRSVCFGNGKFVAVDNGAIFTSPDGVAWSEQGGGSDFGGSSIAYGNGIYNEPSPRLSGLIPYIILL